jgi:hypothetical protein
MVLAGEQAVNMRLKKMMIAVRKNALVEVCLFVI